MTSPDTTSSVTRFLESTESLVTSENTNNTANKTIIYICGLLLVIVLFIQINYQNSYQASTNNLVYCGGASGALKDLTKAPTENAIVNPMTQFRKFGNTNSIIEVENVKTEQEHLVSGNQQFIPHFYVITPTYARVTQKADLTSVLQAAAASKLRIHFILVEDTTKPDPSDLLKHFAEDYPKMNENLKISLLTQKTVSVMHGHRGVYQRNAGLAWVETHQVNSSAIVYFGDDDNTYDQRLYHEFSQVGTNGTILGVLPVGLSGGAEYEGPLCSANGTIKSWHTSYRPERTIALDMAGFAFTVQALLDTHARMDVNWPGGRLESMFATEVTNMSRLAWQLLSVSDQSKVLPLADCGKHVYVWHTKTKSPGRLKSFGPKIEVKK